MSITSGVLSQTSVAATTAVITLTAATGGTGPYTYQLYVSTDPSFSPGGGTLIAGATSLVNTVTGLIPNTGYTFKAISTDTGHSNDTVTSTGLAVATLAPTLNPNQFAQSPYLGQLDLPYNYNTIAAQIDVTQATPIFCGAAVKIVDSVGGVPKVVSCTADSDEVFGFLNFNIKNISFTAGVNAEISQVGNVMYLYSTTAIARGARVTLDLTTNGGVAASASTNRIVGYSLDKATAPGQLIRIHLLVPSFTLAS